MALAVPLSRFTSRVGGGSAFFVRRHSRTVKKRYVIIALEIVLFAIFVYASNKMDRRAVMFDSDLLRFYDLVSSHAITAFIALPLFCVGYIFMPRIPRFAACSVGVRRVTFSAAAIAIYCVVWCVLNAPIRPPGWR